ncbi:MAG: ribosome recycling factor [Actinomycetota bacterium]
MAKAVTHLKDEMGGVRTGRANTSLLNRVTVDYYGAQTPLQQLAGISVQEGRTLVIQPFDRNSVGAIEKAIQTSDLGITPQSDGALIRLTIPQLTQERRNELVKVVHGLAEDGRVAVRNVRRHDKEKLERLEREGTISEDDLKRAEKELQKLTDQHVAEIDEILAHKEQELKEIA